MSISLTIIIIIITVLISYQAFERMDIKQKLMFIPTDVARNNTFSRFITSGFVHADWAHLGINMYVLYIFGEFAERTYLALFGEAMGRVYFLLLYLGAIVIANLPSYIKHQNNYSYAALGASGGTSAIVFTFIIFLPWEWFIFPPLPAVLFGIGYLWYSSYMSKRNLDNIGHDAHFWGAVFGFVFTLALIAIFRADVLPGLLDRLMEGPSIPNF